MTVQPSIPKHTGKLAKYATGDVETAEVSKDYEISMVSSEEAEAASVVTGVDDGMVITSPTRRVHTSYVYVLSGATIALLIIILAVFLLVTTL
jgi:hypothetical protein